MPGRHSRERVQRRFRERSGGSHEDEVSRLIVRGDALHRAMLKEPNEFIVDGSDIQRGYLLPYPDQIL